MAMSVLLFLHAIDCTKWQKWQWWPDLVGTGRRQQPQAGCEAIWLLHLWRHGSPDACCMARTGCSPAAYRSTALVAGASPAKQSHSSHTTLQVTCTTAVKFLLAFVLGMLVCLAERRTPKIAQLAVLA